MYSASTIAKWFLAWADLTEDGDSDLSALKLQKLLYYAQGHYLAANGRPLFPEKIKAWSHGPVVPQVWHEYKSKGSQSLGSPDASEFNWDEVNSADTDFLVAIWNRYGGYSAWFLRNKTHQESPWIDAWDGPGDEIDLHALAAYFEPLNVVSH